MLSKDALDFLADLKRNNNRDWFIGQKKRYENYKKEYLGLAADLLAALQAHDASLETLEPKDCTFRINRDIRFSADKSPYKTHMGLWFSGGSKVNNRPGYYVQIEDGNAFIAGGLYQPEAAELKKIRREIAFFHDDLESILENPGFKSVFNGLSTEGALKTAPKGYEKDHPAIEFLKLKSFVASATFPVADASKRDFVSKTAEKLLTLKPLNDFIDRALNESED